MRRRAFLAGLLVSAPALAHTPYGQWVTYRRKHSELTARFRLACLPS